MKKKFIIALGGAAVVVAAIVCVVLHNTIFATAEYTSEYNKIFGEFTADTASQLLKDKKENTCYSPVSLFGAMSLSTEVTESDTQKELLKALGVQSLDDLESYYTQMLGELAEEKDNSNIVLGNSLWLKGDVLTDALDNKVDELKKDMDCELFLNSDINVSEINSWVEDKTNGLIVDILSESTKPKDMVLVNTLYYKSKWTVKVDKKDQKQDFHMEDGSSVQVDFLSTGKQSFECTTMKDFTYVVIPMEAGELILVLPDVGKSPNSIMKEKNINRILAEITSEKENDKKNVKVEFPTYDIEYEVDSEEMKKTLQEIGIKTLFSQPKWIEGINGSAVEVFQKARFIVNEEGVEGAAATPTISYVAAGANEDEPLELTFDRPFMYILMKDGVPLFIGTVYNPAE